MEIKTTKIPGLSDHLPHWLSGSTLVIYGVVILTIIFFNFFISLPVYNTFESYIQISAQQGNNITVTGISDKIRASSSGKQVTIAIFPADNSQPLNINGKITLAGSENVTIALDQPTNHLVNHTRYFSRITVLLGHISIFKKIKSNFIR